MKYLVDSIFNWSQVKRLIILSCKCYSKLYLDYSGSIFKKPYDTFQNAIFFKFIPYILHCFVIIATQFFWKENLSILCLVFTIKRVLRTRQTLRQTKIWILHRHFDFLKEMFEITDSGSAVSVFCLSRVKKRRFLSKV